MSSATPPAPSATDLAYRHVKRALLDGTLDGGTMLTEGEVAAELGMSRTPVREAFLRLAAEGWLRLFPKRGALVVPVAAGEAEAVLDARVLLESHAAAALCAGDPADLDRAVGRLRAAVDEQEALLRAARGDERALDAYAAADTAFHQAIVAAGGNPLLTEFYAALGERQRRMTARIARTAAAARALVDEHTRLVGLVAAGDADGFADALVAHLERAHGVARQGAAHRAGSAR